MTTQHLTLKTLQRLREHLDAAWAERSTDELTDQDLFLRMAHEAVPQLLDLVDSLHQLHRTLDAHRTTCACAARLREVLPR